MSLTRRGFLGSLIAGLTLPRWLSFKTTKVATPPADAGYYQYRYTFITADSQETTPMVVTQIPRSEQRSARKLYKSDGRNHILIATAGPNDREWRYLNNKR